MEEIVTCRDCSRKDACFLANEVKTVACLFGCLAWPKTFSEMPFDPRELCETLLRNIACRCKSFVRA